jgi:uncharacterized protein YjbJ (UPF0337 family)
MTVRTCPRKHQQTGAIDMNKDRIAGAAKHLMGVIEEATGKIIGDAKLVTDGQTDKTEGVIQNAVGGMMDLLKSEMKK